MLFNSIEFAIFLPVVFFLYWFGVNKNLKQQNILLLLAGYIFYGWWDWRFLSLIVFSSAVDYFVGVGLGKSDSQRDRRLLLLVSVLVNLGFLAFFKYFNFFAESFADAFTLLGKPIEATRLQIILPIGISFYTFQTLSYSIDVYKRKIKPSEDIIAFFTFVSFFPQLVAGPIERASNLLPQFSQKRVFDYEKAVDGVGQILWGLFKKVVIADNCAEYANLIFNNSGDYSGGTLLLGALFFSFQIYGDFSGYSDIAIGTSRLFGFQLMQNFAFPYFSRDIAEFWRRWHISLSTWFRDYLYIPLGGSRGGVWLRIRNTFIIFLVSGFWHGANWTFVIWGALHACYFLPLLLLNQNRRNIDIVAKGKLIPTLREVLNMGTTFFLVMIAWVFFRAENVTHALAYISEIFSTSIFTIEKFDETPEMLRTILFILVFLAIEWAGKEEAYAIAKFGLSWRRPLKWGVYYVLVISILSFAGEQAAFIYLFSILS